MDRMLVVVFDNEKTAYDGSRALQQLDDDGSIAVYASAVLAKNADGTTEVKHGDEASPWGTLAGTAVGSLIGILGGPVGVAVGAVYGAMVGAIPDLDNARVGSDFVDDVGKTLTPGKVALVAEVDEDWITPVDTRMEAIGGTVYRRSVSEVKSQLHEENVASMKADLASMKAESAQAKADQKSKIQSKMDQLDGKIQAQMQRNKDRL